MLSKCVLVFNYTQYIRAVQKQTFTVQQQNINSYLASRTRHELVLFTRYKQQCTKPQSGRPEISFKSFGNANFHVNKNEKQKIHSRHLQPTSKKT